MLSDGDARSALATFDRLLREAPDDALAWRGRARALVRMAEAYQAIDLLVVPSLWLENSPLVIHEAYQSLRPVIGSRIGGICELVQDGWNGLLFDPGSAAGLASGKVTPTEPVLNPSACAPTTFRSIPPKRPS